MKVVLPVRFEEEGSKATHVVIELATSQCATLIRYGNEFDATQAPVSLLGFDLRALPLLTEFVEVVPGGYPCLDAIDKLSEGEFLIITDAQYTEISEVFEENAAYVNSGACEYVFTRNTGYERNYLESVDMDTMDGLTVYGFHLAVQAVADAIVAQYPTE